MKIVEALKKIKHNRSKIEDLIYKIKSIAANMESESNLYPDAKKKIKEYSQSIEDTLKENAHLQVLLQKTNNLTTVTIEIGNKQVQKTITEWIIRRREGVDIDISMLQALTTRNLKPKILTQTTDESGNPIMDRVILNFDPNDRDAKLSALSEEKYLIDSALEIINATTDIITDP